MSVEKKWSDRIYREPKKGSDYTSTKINTALRNQDRPHRDSKIFERDDAQLEAVKSELSDVQLVVNHLEQRIDRVETLAQQEDRLVELQARIRRLEVFILMLIAAFVIAVTLKILNGMGIHLIPQLAEYVAQAMDGFDLV